MVNLILWRNRRVYYKKKQFQADTNCYKADWLSGRRCNLTGWNFFVPNQIQGLWDFGQLVEKQTRMQNIYKKCRIRKKSQLGRNFRRKKKTFFRLSLVEIINVSLMFRTWYTTLNVNLYLKKKWNKNDLAWRALEWLVSKDNVE